MQLPCACSRTLNVYEVHIPVQSYNNDEDARKRAGIKENKEKSLRVFA